MKKVLILILVIYLLSFFNKPVKIKVLKNKEPKKQDTLTPSQKEGIKQIKFLDSLHKIGKF